MTHKMRSILFSVPFVVLAGCESEVAPTGPSTDVSMARSLPSAYTAVDLDPVSSAFSKATGINPAGRIVGMTSGSVATRWWKGIATSLGNPGGCCIANAINSAGDIVGHSFLSGRARAFLWSNGVMSDLGSLGGTYSEAMALNAKRQVVGRSFTATGTQHAFLWEKGVIIDLGTLGGTSSIAYGINTAGQVVGYSTLATGAWHAFLWQSGTMTDLGTLGGCCSSAAGINSAGQVVGYSVVDNKFHAFLWEKGVMSDLGAPGGDSPDSFASAINSAGDVVGYSVNAAHSGTRALLWSKGKMINLATPAGDQSAALAINPKGDVVGLSGRPPISYTATLWTKK